jgi:hypothetical protein
VETVGIARPKKKGDTMKKAFVALTLLLLSGCADTLEAAKGMDPNAIWATAGVLLAGGIAAALIIGGWPQLVIKQKTVIKEKCPKHKEPEPKDEPEDDGDEPSGKVNLNK